MIPSAMWMLVIAFFSPATGQAADYQIGLFFSRPGCEYAAEAIAARAATEGYVPLGFSCTELQRS
jgi:hypothetical protein